jgi:hypothetical protein
MARLNRFSGLLLTVLLLAAGASSQARAAEPINLTDDGWYTWRVASTGEYDEEQFYVQLNSGQPTEIEIVGHWCNSWNRSAKKYPEATDLGLLDTDTSIDWLQQLTGERSDLSSDALAAISMHEGSRAVQILIDVVESDAHMDVREEAVFWMAQSDSEEAFDYLDRLLMIN